MSTPASRRLGARLVRSYQHSSLALLVRRLGEYNDYGEWAEGDPVESDIRVVEAPLSGQERLQLPEKLRERDLGRFWTTAEAEAIVVGTEDSDQDGDVIRFDGVEYRCVRVQNWGGFREVLGVKPEAAPAELADA